MSGRTAVFDFSYTGDVQEFEVPTDGLYQLEVWGAEGGTDTYLGGRGGYSTGRLNLRRGEILYVYVGGRGGNYNTSYNAFNGGGRGGTTLASRYGGGGGGATDIRRTGTSLGDRVIVAGGGGGADANSSVNAGDGGGDHSTAPHSSVPVATQTNGFSLGNGQDGGTNAGGGGGGYWGGYANASYGGSGGSGYVGGVLEGETIAGNLSLPAPNGGTQVGHRGHGYARISILTPAIEIRDLRATKETVHKEDTSIVGQIDREDVDNSYETQVSYKIVVNGVDFIRWGEFKEIPFNIDVKIPNKILQEEVNEVRVDVRDLLGYIVGSAEVTVTLDNKPPEVSYQGATKVNREPLTVGIKVEDEEQDSVKYRLLLNGQPLTEWSNYLPSGKEKQHTFTNQQLQMGVNILTIEAEDDYHRLTGKSVKEITIVKEGSIPEIKDLRVTGNEVHALIEDLEEDDVLYEVTINDEVIKPFDVYVPTPVQVKTVIPKHLIEEDREHTVKMTVKDRQWNTITEEGVFRIGYGGIMFQDLYGKYYSSDLGVILQRLTIDSVLAGEVSPTYEVYLNNTTGYDLKDVTLVVDHHELQEELENVQLSKEEEPFEPRNSLVFGRINYNEVVPFYVRLKTASESAFGGIFKIKVHAKPIR